MIYTDNVHLVADSLEELHEFARRIGLSRSYFQGTRKGHPHYDLTSNRMRYKAMANGAKTTDIRTVLEKSKKLIV